MKNSWRFLLGMLLLLGLLAVVSANPLLVTYQERYNITAEVNGNGTTSYTIHNLTGYIIINNTASKDVLSDVWVAVNILNNKSAPYVSYNGTPKKVYITYTAPDYTGLPPGLTYIHIPVLPANSYVEVAIPLDIASIPKAGVPVIVKETYSITKVPANKRVKWNVTLTIEKNTSALPNGYAPVLVNVTKYLSNDPNHYGSSYWTFLNITKYYYMGIGKIKLWDGPYFSGSTNDSLNCTDIELRRRPETITFTVEADNNFTGREVTEVPYGFAVIFFKYNGTLSGTKVEGVYAVGDSSISIGKKGPDYDESTGEYTLWYENVSFKNNGSEYYYNLTKVSIWAVDGSNPTNLDPFNVIPGSNHSLSLNEILEPGGKWESETYSFTFNGTPVIWANCTFSIAESNITLLNNTVNQYHDEYGSSYIVIEKIYVVGSYLIKVTKTIKSNQDGSYTIYIVVENIGGKKSPDIYVYDLIPYNFTIVDGPVVNRSYMCIENNSYPLPNNPRYYKGLYWHLKPLNGGADGDGWYNDEELDNNQTVLITYMVNGTGTFLPSDLFIVGVDPTHTLLPTTSPKMVIVGGSSGNNYEILLALMTGVVGMALVVRKVKR